MPKKSKVTDRYDSILLEGIRSDFRIVAESVSVLHEKVESLVERFDGLEQRFEGLEQRFDGLEQRFDGMAESIHLQMLRSKNEIVSQITKRVDPLENRVTRCESDIARIKATRPQ